MKPLRAVTLAVRVGSGGAENASACNNTEESAPARATAVLTAGILE